MATSGALSDPGLRQKPGLWTLASVQSQRPRPRSALDFGPKQVRVIETDRINIIAEKRKWQMEVENKRHQLEDDRRSLQHLKSKALRERWLLDGAPSGGAEHEEVKKQLEQDEQRSRELEEHIRSLETELLVLESDGGPNVTPAPVVKTELVSDLDLFPVKPEPHRPVLVSTAAYSLEIRVERDKATGETRVLSANPMLPVDPALGVKVYEDERKVVHEMNGEDGGHILSSFEVEELIHKADEASVMSKTITTITTSTITTAATATTEEAKEEAKEEVKEVAVEEAGEKPTSEPKAREASSVPSVEITGLEAKPDKDPSVSEATEENPVTMVFMGYQNVEDEAETKRVLGLKGTVKAELVVIEEEGKTSPVTEEKAKEKSPQKAVTPSEARPKAPAAEKHPTPEERRASPMDKENGEAKASSEEVRGGDAEEKSKQPCKCCIIM
uniref:Paralemmin-1 n=1 Tax=Knipowitschia caucasica TaxID=637954 RepID=A0AAV2KS61_KNICA